MALPDVNATNHDGCHQAGVIDSTTGFASEDFVVRSAGWLLVVNKYSGKSSLHSLRDCMTHWLHDDIDVQCFSSSTSTSGSSTAVGSDTPSTQVSEHNWRVFAEFDLKSVLNLSTTADILSVTEYERAICVSYSMSDDTRSGGAELVVANVFAQP